MPRRLQLIVELLDDDPRLLQRIESHDMLAPAMREAAFVFEAAPEKLPLKQKIFAELEGAVAPTMVLASNSSAIPSTGIGRHLVHREGRHPFLESAASGAAGRSHPERKDRR